MNDLISVLALPAVWSGSEPEGILETFLDSLLVMLDLDFLFARVRLNSHHGAIDTIRIASRYGTTYSRAEIRQALDQNFGDPPPQWPDRILEHPGDDGVAIFPLQMGIGGELGFIVAGSQRVGFPEQTEKLILNVAANQAAVGLQHAILLHEQKQVAEALDLRVSQRTAELAAANEVLKTEIAERKSIENRLRESETNFRRIVDSIPGLVCTMNLAGEVESVNRHYQEYFGKTLEEIKNWANSDMMHPDDFSRVLVAYAHSMENGSPYDVEARLRRADGQYRWFQVRALPVRDTDGKVSGWYALLTDIDDRKLAENALRASERNLVQIINTIPTTAWSTRPDGYCYFLSDRWLDYAGFTFEQAVGWNWATVIHPDDADGLSEYWQACLASGTPVDTEARMRRFDGVYRWFLFRANPFRDESGNITKWFGANIDIEDRKKAENALRANEDDLVRIINTIPMLAWSTLPDGYVDFLNQRWLDFTGLSAEEAGGLGWSVAIHPDDAKGLVEYWQGALASGSHVDVEARMRRFDGEYRWFIFRADPLRDESGTIVKWYGTNTDIDDRKRAEEELRSTQAELARMMRVMTIGQLTASIAHEVSQPLSGIITNASTCVRMLNSDPPNVDGARETAQRAIRDGKRATEVITRLRTLFSKKQINIERVHLNEAAREVVALVSDELHKHRVTVQQHFSDRLRPVTGDRVQLQQVILNLIRNALDALLTVDDRPRQLLIRTAEEGEHAAFYIQDSGVGFDPANLARLFESFFTTKEDGMGMGLSLSRSIIEAHQGQLWATRNEGPGATFAFSVPYSSGLQIDSEG